MRCYNLPKAICRHLVGKEHDTHHHMLAGVFVMVVGVAIAKSVEFFHFPGAHFALDLVGYGVHGLGLTPFIEAGIKAIE